MASGSIASVIGFVACVFQTSGCGGTILLGSNERDASDIGGLDGGMVAFTEAASGANHSSDDGGVGEDANAGVVTVLATGQFTPTSIVVDANNVYWVNEGMPGQVAAAPCTTCTSDSDCLSTCGPAPQTNYRWCCDQSMGRCVAADSPCSNPGNPTNKPFGPVQIMKCAKSGCNNSPTVLVSDLTDWGNGDRLRGLAVDGTNVYWGSTTAVFACAINGCDNAPVILHRIVGTAYEVGGGIAVPPEIAASNQTVYASDPGAVYSASASTNGETALFSRNDSFLHITVDDTTVYAAGIAQGTPQGVAQSDTIEIASCAIGGCGGAPTLLASSLGVPTFSAGLLGPLLVDDTNVYWSQGVFMDFNQVANGFIPFCGNPGTAPSGLIFMCAKGGGCNNGHTLLASGLNCLIGMATDGANVYFSESMYFGGGLIEPTVDANVGRIAKCDVRGCSDQATTLVSALNNPRGVAVDEAHVYWTDFGSGGTVTAMTSTSRVYSNDGRVMMMAK